MFELAHTVWPRFGGDRANRSLLNVSGPHAMPTWQKIPLSACQAAYSLRDNYSGVIIMPDESLRVLENGVLSAVTFAGTILWQLDLSALDVGDEEVHDTFSLPTATQAGETLLVRGDAFLIVDNAGNCRRERTLSGEGHNKICALDDSGFSPNLTSSGQPILTCCDGGVYAFKDGLHHEIGVFGYDIVTPAIYPDDTLAIAGYASTGFCRVSLDGRIRWKTAFFYADLLPTLNHRHIAAVGSLNDDTSAFYKPDGSQIGEYQHAAKFAVHPSGDWIALSKQRLARLTLQGDEIWSCALQAGESLSFVEQPLVDKDGYIYVRQKEGFLCIDEHGHKAFEVQLSSLPQGPMSILAPGVVAYTLDGELVIGHC